MMFVCRLKDNANICSQGTCLLFLFCFPRVLISRAVSGFKAKGQTPMTASNGKAAQKAGLKIAFDIIPRKTSKGPRSLTSMQPTKLGQTFPRLFIGIRRSFMSKAMGLVGKVKLYKALTAIKEAFTDVSPKCVFMPRIFIKPLCEACRKSFLPLNLLMRP